MVRENKCSFCGGEIEPGTGLMYVKLDGTILWFCSRRCYKSYVVFNRDPRKLKWTKFYKAQTRG